MKYIIPILLVLVACTATVNDPRVEQFLDIYPEASQSSEKFGANDVAFTEEFFSEECAEAPPYNRIVYAQYGAKLITYVKGGEIVCAVSKIEPASLAVEQGDMENGPEGVAFEVNGNPIMFEQVQAVYATLSEEEQTTENINTIIDQLVTQELLSQEAAVYEVDVDTEYNSLIEQFVTEENLSAALEDQGTTIEALKNQLETQLKVQALLDDKLGTFEVDDDTAKQFYMDNTDAFIVSEQSTFQQVFVDTQSRTEEQTTLRVQQIVTSLNNTDFCTVVKTYSDDDASKDRCGIYTAPRGVLHPNIEQAVFTATIGELVGVQTETGFHFINVLERQPASVLRYAEAQAQVAGYVQGQVQQMRLNAYLSTLRTNAKIVSYLTAE